MACAGIQARCSRRVASDCFIYESGMVTVCFRGLTAGRAPSDDPADGINLSYIKMDYSIQRSGWKERRVDLIPPMYRAVIEPRAGLCAH